MSTMLADERCRYCGHRRFDAPTLCQGRETTDATHDFQPFTPPEGEGDLLPCPFCGGTAEFDRIAAPQSDLYGVRVRCTVCGAGITTKQSTDLTTADEGAVTAWNRRSHLSREREPDGWISRWDADRVRDPNRTSVPSVNVWASRDDGDIPVYIGDPPEDKP